MLGALGGALRLRISLPPPCLACGQTRKHCAILFSFVCFGGLGFSYRFKPISLRPVAQLLELTFAIRMTTVLLHELR